MIISIYEWLQTISFLSVLWLSFSPVTAGQQIYAPLPAPYHIAVSVSALVFRFATADFHTMGGGRRAWAWAWAIQADIALLPTVAAKRVKCLTSAKFAQSKARQSEEQTEDDKRPKDKIFSALFTPPFVAVFILSLSSFFWFVLGDLF